MNIIKIFILVFVITFFWGCNNSDNSLAIKEQNKDSISRLTSVIGTFNTSEKASLDSIKKYNLDSINSRCLSILYVLYCRDTINYSDEKTLTIGECKIRLIKFQNISANNIQLQYGVFIKDSIPINWFNIKNVPENRIRAFVVADKRKLVEARVTENLKINLSDVEKNYDSILTNDKFKKYITEYKDKLNSSFKVSLKFSRVIQ